MHSLSDPAFTPTVVPATAVAATLERLRRLLRRTMVFMVVLCVSIGALLSTFEHGRWVDHWTYSFTIAYCCWGLMSLLRLLLAWASDRRRAWRGLPASPAGFETGWRGMLPAMLLSVVLGPPLGMSIADAITGYRSPSLLQLDASNTRVTIALTIIASLAAVFVLSTLERLANTRVQAELARRQAAEAQLKLIESQLEPHMLFNTLATLRALIGIDPPRAQAMLDRLIAFLRATLSASRTATHPLAAEFDRLADYLALMALRMGPRLATRLELPDALRAHPVPPLLLQPLVENAIKHGVEPKVGGGRIEVRAARDGDALMLTVRDTGLGLGAAATPGTQWGNLQIRERLHTLHGDAASFTLAPAGDAEGGALASIRLPYTP